MTKFGLSYGTYKQALSVFNRMESGIYFIMMTRLGRYHVVMASQVKELKKLGAQIVL
jgi:hypothetical protein